MGLPGTTQGKTVELFSASLVFCIRTIQDKQQTIGQRQDISVGISSHVIDRCFYFQFFKLFFVIPDSDNRLLAPYLWKLGPDLLGCLSNISWRIAILW